MCNMQGLHSRLQRCLMWNAFVQCLLCSRLERWLPVRCLKQLSRLPLILSVMDPFLPQTTMQMLLTSMFDDDGFHITHHTYCTCPVMLLGHWWNLKKEVWLLWWHAGCWCSRHQVYRLWAMLFFHSNEQRNWVDIYKFSGMLWHFTCCVRCWSSRSPCFFSWVCLLRANRHARLSFCHHECISFCCFLQENCAAN